MKVILVGPSNRFHGGISSYLEVTAMGLANAGHEVGLILLDRLLPRFLYPGKGRLNDNPSLDYEHENINTLHVMNYYDLTVPRKARMSIAEFNPDLAIIHWWTFAVFPMLSKAFRTLSKTDCPLFIEMHEVIDQNDSRIPLVSSTSKVLGKRVLDKATNVIVHSNADRRLVLQHYGIKKEQVRVIPLANNSKFGDRLELDTARERLGIQHSKVLLYFGLIRKYKGVTGLIKAFEMIETKDVLLMVVGEIWDERKEIESLISKSPKKKDILLIDRFVDDAEIPIIYSSANTLAMPYTRASQSGVSGLAMDFGIPIVSFSVGGLEEGIGGYENTTLVEPGDLVAFSKAIEKSLRMQFCQPGGNSIEDVVEVWLDLANGDG
jgi:glycosyltransferase involved in cell wall biosynthesis